ncbi:MAG: hypothetical protein GY780_15785 [bacterium]|nr:hypothetical protein [bacterium]
MIDLQQLNAHSKLFAELLFRQWPEWGKYAKFDPYEDFEKEALLVEVPRPVDGSSHGLFITTSEWEISVGFGESFHTRFGSDGDSKNSNFNEKAIEFIRDFIDEKVVLANARENGEWLGGWKIDLRETSLHSVEVESGVEVFVTSWLGTHDQKLV